MSDAPDRITAVFLRQRWVNDYALPDGEPVPFDATASILALPAERIRVLRDDEYPTDALAEDLPERTAHGGPFLVRVEEAIRRFFDVENLDEITDEMVEDRRARLAGAKAAGEDGGFLPCPECEAVAFTEVTLEYCSQKGVRIARGGEPDYDASDKMEIDGVTERVVHYRCEGCGKTWRRLKDRLAPCGAPEKGE